MELRNCSHLHFICAVKGGSEIKTLNVFMGRPALKMKQLTDIYETDDSGNQAAFPTFRPTRELEDVPTKQDKSQAESSSTLTRERTGNAIESLCTRVKSEIDDDFSCMTLKQVKERCKENKRKYSKISTRKKGDETIKNDNDEMEFCCTSTVTEVKSETEDDFMLKQVKERCKERKRKYSKVGRRKKGDQNCITERELHSNCKIDEDDFDGMETLCSFRSKLPKKAKIKKRSRKNDYLLPNYALTIVKSEEITTEQVLSFNETFYPIAIKIEDAEPGYSDCENSFKFNEFSSVCTEVDVSDGMLYLEWPDMATNDILQTGVSKISGQELETGEVCVPDTEPSFITRDENKRADCFRLEDDVPMFNVPQVRFGNEENNEYIDPNVADGPDGSNVFVFNKLPNTTKFCSSATRISIGNDLEACLLKAKTLRISDEEQRTANNFEMGGQLISYNEPQTCVIEHADSKVIVDVRSSNDEELMGLRDDGIDNDGSLLEASVSTSLVGGCNTAWNSTLISDPNGYSVSLTNESPLDKEKQSKVTLDTLVAKDIYPVSDPCIDGQTVSTKNKGFHDSKLQQTPQRLFFNRKTISPTSQQRLCRAMESTELDDEQYYKYTRKLCYSKLAKNKIGINGANRAKKADVITIRKQNHGDKFYNNGQNGILKDFVSDHPVQHITSGSTSIRSCSLSAITFSQQQLHDAQYIATKLMRELKAMKEIVNEGLQYRENTTSSNCNLDEVRTAIQNAARVEETTRKCLSIMARDCNRFCKIMRLTGEASSAPENPINKVKKRKIAFADEAGGKLCDVKTFENGTSSLGDNFEIVDL